MMEKKVRKPGTQKGSPKSEVGNQKSEKENNFAFDIPNSEIKPATYNTQPATQTMEVHHHPDLHHEKKPWKEYFLEFLMIFLAVTMGFFAETIRENISENAKAKELAKSLYQEVYNDSVIMQSKINLRNEKERHMEYCREYLRDSSLTNLSAQFYPSFMWTFIITATIDFDPNDGVLNQLRNSGALRYFKNIELQNAVSRINTAIFNVRSRNNQEYAYNEQYVRPFILKHYDFIWEDAYTQHGKLSIMQALRQINFQAAVLSQIRNLNDLKRDEADALIAYYILIIRSTKQIHYAPYVIANHQLLQTLRKEYNFNNE
jgi:hypothetical protein